MNSSTEDLAPVVLFLYNRPEHTSRTLDALANNTLSQFTDLYVFCDGPKNEDDEKKVSAVRNILKDLLAFKNVYITKYAKNRGLAASVINGVTEVLKKRNRVVVLEDDLVTSKYFLAYMNKALNIYEENHQVFSISGYNYPPKVFKIPADYQYDAFFVPRNSSWGWATWKDRWDKADWTVSDYDDFIKDKKKQKDFNRGGEDLTRLLKMQMKGQIDSWSIRWTYTHFLNNAVSVWPVCSYVNNIGADGSGTHLRQSNKMHNDLKIVEKDLKVPASVFLDPEMMGMFRIVFHRFVIYRLLRRIYWFLKDVVYQGS